MNNVMLRPLTNRMLQTMGLGFPSAQGNANENDGVCSSLDKDSLCNKSWPGQKSTPGTTLVLYTDP
jgi:hypothetical protein